MSAVHYVSVEMVHFADCGECGVPIYGPRNYFDACNRDHRKGFHCINGHSRVFVGETEAQRLRRELEVETKRKEWAQQESKRARHAESIAKGKLKAQSERVKNGVCPCCNRSFQNLRRHMETKHPEFGSVPRAESE